MAVNATERSRRRIIAGKVQTIAAARRVSGNRAIVDLVDDAIQADDQRRKAFFELADTLAEVDQRSRGGAASGGNGENDLRVLKLD